MPACAAATLAPLVLIAPGAALALLILAFNFFGDGVADALNPRRSSRGT